MSETSPIPQKNIDGTEARRRLEELAPVARLAHEYSRVERGTEHEDGTVETDGDHVVHLGILAVAYALKYRPDLDPGRVALYVLLHDIDEAKVGDTPTLGATVDMLEEKYALEAEGRRQVEADLEDFPELIKLLRSIDRLERSEDKFGKAFDKIAPGYLHSVTSGRTLEKFGITNRQELIEANLPTDAKMQTYTEEHPDVMALRRAMHDRVGDHSFPVEESSL